MPGSKAKADPRLDSDRSAFDEGELLVAQAPGGGNPLLIAGLFVVAGLALFLFLNGKRLERTSVRPAGVAVAVRPAPPLELPAALPRPVNPALFPSPALAVMPAFVTPIAAAKPAGPSEIEVLQRLRAPSVVVDLQSPTGGSLVLTAAGQGASAPAGGTGAAVATAGPALAADTKAAAGAAGGGGYQASIDRLGGTADAAPPTALATQLGNLGATITQGAIMPAVLETAINSDIPGYARAVVSRDVLSFDGRQVLIPRSSRLIGEYRSALALGQSRVFVIWTRVIRPDGVSVEIGSPGADALGRGGLEGEVDRHFFSRFGGSILLSVLNAGVAAVSRTPSTQVTIGSPAAAVAAAGSATTGSTDLPPTIDVRQGTAISIFVARDLDFSRVQAVR